MNSQSRHVGYLIIVILAATQLPDVRAAVNVTFDDRVLYLNGYIDGFDGFNEYFDDAFASPTGDFVSPAFSKIINDGRSSFVSFVNSGTEIDALIDLDSTDVAQFVGVGLSYGDVFVDPNDANAGSAFGSSEFDIDFLLTNSTYRFSFAGTLNSSGAGRSSASLYDGLSLSDPAFFEVNTDTSGPGTYAFDGLIVPGEYRLDIFATTYINITAAPGDETGSAGYDFSMSLVPARGDFNLDGLYSCEDIDDLVATIAAETNQADFDLTGDGIVDLADRDAWLMEAGAVQVASGNPYKLGDANLDGRVDGEDFIIWNANKFANHAAWCRGDFTADGNVDGLDFIEWNRNKFTSSDGASAVPEPRISPMMMVFLIGILIPALART